MDKWLVYVWMRDVVSILNDKTFNIYPDFNGGGLIDVDNYKKGAKGGDCILTINSENKEAIGQIYFESKERHYP